MHDTCDCQMDPIDRSVNTSRRSEKKSCCSSEGGFEIKETWSWHSLALSNRALPAKTASSGVQRSWPPVGTPAQSSPHGQISSSSGKTVHPSPNNIKMSDLLSLLFADGECSSACLGVREPPRMASRLSVKLQYHQLQQENPRGRLSSLVYA